MPTPLTEQLMTIGRSIQISAGPDPGGAPRTFLVKLSLPGESEGALLQVEETGTEIVRQLTRLQIDWIVKNVRFADTDLAHQTPLGGMPAGSHLHLNLRNMPTTSLLGTLDGTVESTPPEAVQGLPGLVGRITATLPMDTRQPMSTPYPVEVTVEWRVMDGEQIDPAVNWVINPGPGETSGTGGTIPPIHGATDVLKLTFPPPFVELLRDTPAAPVVQRTIHARVRLFAPAAGVSSEEIDLPPVTLSLPAIPVPSVLVLCQNPNFGGRVFVMVPGNSMANDIPTLRTALGNLSAALARLLPSSSLVFTAITMIPGLVADEANMRFRMGNEIERLSDVVYTDLFGIRTFSAEDSMSSLLFVGAPGRQIQCFNQPSFATAEGQMNVTVGSELVVQINSLGTPAPTSNPAGRVSIPIAPAGQRFLLRNVNSFAGELSSLKFAWE
jgi:hypothetical protein